MVSRGAMAHANLASMPTAEAGHGLARLADALSDELVRLAARVLGSSSEAEDVVQNVWARLVEKVRRRELEQVSAIKTWLYRVVLNEALNARRAQARRQLRERQWQPRDVDGHQAMEASAALRQVAALLDALPADQAQVLVLKEFHQLRASQIAEVLQCSEGAVEQRLVRARAALRRRLGDE